MAITQIIRDQLLVEACHRCTVCAEKCFEIHHIIEQAEGGADTPDNLIVLCPNCHQHRIHRAREFTREQIFQYKAKLKEKNEIERRLLLNLDAIRIEIGKIPVEESERQIKQEIQEATSLISPERSPALYSGITEISRWLAEREIIRGGARRAIEIEWEIQRQRELEEWPEINLVRIAGEESKKAPDFAHACTFVLVLDHHAYQGWEELFAHYHSHSYYSMNRRTYIEGDRIVMIVADIDNLQEHANFIKKIVEETNTAIKNRVIPAINSNIEMRKAAALREFDMIQGLKLRTQDIKL